MSLMVVRKSDASKFTTGFTTTTTCGGISAGTSIEANTSVQKVVEDMVYRGIDPTDPNTRYESKDLGTWSSTSDVDTFCATYNHANNYTGLSLGNYVTIQDSASSVAWEIAGFDLEYNRTAIDGTVYNNGYGILMIPKRHRGSCKWANYSSSGTSYINSYMHATQYPTDSSNLRTILGSHMIQRNVLLGSEQKGAQYESYTKRTSGYTWTTSYLTSMSLQQMKVTASIGVMETQYDIGEARYILPIFNYETSYDSDGFWTRSVCGLSGMAFYIYYAINNGINKYKCQNSGKLRPVMLLR